MEEIQHLVQELLTAGSENGALQHATFFFQVIENTVPVNMITLPHMCFVTE